MQFELKKYTGKTKIMKSKCGEAMYMTCSTKRRRISELLDNSSLKTEESAELLMKHLPVHSDPLMLASCGSEDGGLEKKLILHPWLTWDDAGCRDSSKHTLQPEDEELPPNMEMLLGDLLEAITSSIDDDDSASTEVDDDHQDRTCAVLAPPELSSI